MEYIYIGRVANTHGIKGEIKVFPTTDDIKRFELLRHIWIENKESYDQYTIDGIKYFKQFVILKLKEITDMTMAERLKRAIIAIPKELALPCEADEYYIEDLMGMQVQTEEGRVLGTLEDIMFTGNNDVYVVKQDKNELLIPAIKECIVKVDVSNKLMIVHLLEGLE